MCSHTPEWNPLSPKIQENQRAAYDHMRELCPVAYHREMGWAVFRYHHIRRILDDPETFSNKVSEHLSVPNGMDPPQHTAYRKIIEPYFQSDRMAEFEPVCRGIAAQLVEKFLNNRKVEFIGSFARPFSAQVQCTFLGWPASLHHLLRKWTAKNLVAIQDQDRSAMQAVASEFENHVSIMLEKRRSAGSHSAKDVTCDLMQQKVGDRKLTDKEIVSILRNWTMGEVGTITAAIGIVAHYLATHLDLQQELRSNLPLLSASIEEMLRIHGPLVSNRRKTTCPVQIGEQKIDCGQIISINWIAANRDRQAFKQPKKFDLNRDSGKNLLYGSGIHICPGAPMARLELRVFFEELLKQTTHITLSSTKNTEYAVYPASGFASLYLQIK